MAKQIHHVGIAVKDIQATADFYGKLLGAELLDYEMETPDFHSRMLRLGGGLFELLEPSTKGGMIDRFLERQGEGIHHVSIAVENLDEILAYCREHGLTTLGDRFIHPKSAHGVLIELIPAPADD